MTFKLGLTGSIGMGKSTTAGLFATRGIPVWDADAAVHRLYEKDGLAVAKIKAVFPDAIEEGKVCRARLREVVLSNQHNLKILETIVHPLLREDRRRFILSTTSNIVVFDMPLLFETGSEKEMDAVVCVSVSTGIQKQRVMERQTMTEDQFETILNKQMANDEKCSRSQYIVDTSSMETAKSDVEKIVSDIMDKIDA